jgi:hypothetical protein
MKPLKPFEMEQYGWGGGFRMEIYMSSLLQRDVFSVGGLKGKSAGII